jgi:glycosyltransferase involved in cell wall biosynthesis
LTVSVIIPTYNRARLLERALRSANPQLLAGDELIVVDDGSTDGTEQVVAATSPRARYIRTSHAGAGGARNRGLDEASGDLVAFLDSDDEWLPGKLALHRALFQARPDVLFSFSDFMVRVGTDTYHGGLRRWWVGDALPGWPESMGPGVPLAGIGGVPEAYAAARLHIADIYGSMLEACVVATFTLVSRRREAGDALRFPEDLPLFEDWECYARLSGKGQAAFLDCETAINHGHPGPRLTDADHVERAEARLKLMERVWGADRAFLAGHGPEYAAVQRERLLEKTRGLLARGNTRDAAATLQVLEEAPAGYKVLAALPGPVTSGILGVRRLLMRAYRG